MLYEVITSLIKGGRLRGYPTLPIRPFGVGFKVNLHHKDLEICQKMSDQNPGIKLVITSYSIHYTKLYDIEIIVLSGLVIA